MTPERGALIPQFRQKAQLVTCLPNNPSLGLSFATIAFVLSHQPLRLGMGEVSGPPPQHTVQRTRHLPSPRKPCHLSQLLITTATAGSSSCSLGCH